MLSCGTDILPVDQNAPAGYIVKSEQQPCQRRFAGPARPDYRQLAARRHCETDIEQDLPVGLVTKIYLLEAQLAVRHRQFNRVGGIANFWHALQQTHQVIHVGQRILDLPVNDAQKIQRNEQLQQQGVDQH